MGNSNRPLPAGSLDSDTVEAYELMLGESVSAVNDYSADGAVRGVCEGITDLIDTIRDEFDEDSGIQQMPVIPLSEDDDIATIPDAAVEPLDFDDVSDTIPCIHDGCDSPEEEVVFDLDNPKYDED